MSVIPHQLPLFGKNSPARETHMVVMSLNYNLKLTVKHRQSAHLNEASFKAGLSTHFRPRGYSVDFFSILEEQVYHAAVTA